MYRENGLTPLIPLVTSWDGYEIEKNPLIMWKELWAPSRILPHQRIDNIPPHSEPSPLPDCAEKALEINNLLCLSHPLPPSAYPSWKRI